MDMIATLLPPALDLGTIVILLVVARQIWGNGKATSQGYTDFLQDLLEAQKGIQELRRRVEEGTTEVPDLTALLTRMEAMELRFTTLVEEVDERSRYARGVWQKIAAAERRLGQSDPEEEGGGEFPGGDAPAGDPSQLPLLQAAVDPDEEKRAQARQAVAFGVR